MNQKAKLLTNKIYKIVFTTFTILLGLSFVILSYTILTKGQEHIENDPSYIIYNREIISQYLNYLLIPFILWVLLVISGFVISLLYKVDTKEKNSINPVDTYHILCKRINGVSKEHLTLIYKERKIRALVFLLLSVISLLLMIFPARYLFDPSHFKGVDTNNEMVMMMVNVFPFIIVAFALYGGYIIYYLKSIKKESSLIKEVLKVTKPSNNIITKDDTLKINIVRGVVFVTSLTFIFIGLLNGGFGDVLNKAVNICKECIGLA